MKAAFLKEYRRYTREELIALLGVGDELATEDRIKRLKAFGILKTIRSSEAQSDWSDLLEDDAVVVEAGSTDATYYTVTFVGLVVVGGCVLKCFPKYLPDDAQPSQKLAQVLKVLEYYGSREQMVDDFNDTSTESQLNLLAVMRFLLRDYYENGAYTKSQELIENSGSGEINWDKTINDTLGLLVDGRPHYVDLRTKRRLHDDRDFFKRLHESVLTQFTRELEDADLLTVLDIPGVDVSDEALDSLGDRDYLLYRIEGELGTQFNTRKQLVLKALQAYLSKRATLDDMDGFALFGSTSFNLVWQDVCCSVIGNQLATPISDLALPTPLKDGYSRTSTLASLIDKPQWTGIDDAGSFTHASDKTLIPDLAAILVVDGKHRLVILDAKYHNIQLHRDKRLSGQPGIGDLTKQYLYQLAFQDFTRSHDITDVRNCFLMPTDNGEIVHLGHASLEMLSRLGLPDIQIKLLPAAEMYDLYLRGERMDISRLRL